MMKNPQTNSRDFAAERAALRQAENDLKASLATFLADAALTLYGIKPGDLVISDGKVYRVSGLSHWYWYPERTPLFSGQPGYVYTMPTNKPNLKGHQRLKDGSFSPVERDIVHEWEKITDEGGANG